MIQRYRVHSGHVGVFSLLTDIYMLGISACSEITQRYIFSIELWNSDHSILIGTAKHELESMAYVVPIFESEFFS